MAAGLTPGLGVGEGDLPEFSISFGFLMVWLAGTHGGMANLDMLALMAQHLVIKVLANRIEKGNIGKINMTFIMRQTVGAGYA